MAPRRIWLVALALLLAWPAAGEPAVRPRFAPGTGTTCSSYCSQRWHADPASARACATGCVISSLTGTSYFLGGTPNGRRDCSEQLVTPAGDLDECTSRRPSVRGQSATPSPF